MEITKISPQAKNPERVNLYVDGAFYRGLDRLVAFQLGLKTGLVLNPDLLDRLETTQSENTTWEWALKSLQASPKSIRDMRQKLSRKFAPELVEQTMTRLIDAGLLDDTKLAERLVVQYEQQATKSRREILLKLRQKGIPDAVLNEARSTMKDELPSALKLAQFKNRTLADTLEWQVRFTKIASYLTRKGFNYAVIRQVVTPENLTLETK